MPESHSSTEKRDSANSYFIPPPHDWPQDEIAQLRYIAQHGSHSQDCDDRILWAASEIERLRAIEARARDCADRERGPAFGDAFPGGEASLKTAEYIARG